MLTKLLMVALAAGISAASTNSVAGHCPPRDTGSQIFRPRLTCGYWTGLEPTPEHYPWTHEPVCRMGKDPDPKSKRKKRFCLYTMSNLTTGRGVSIITTPTVAKSILKKSSFELYDEKLTPRKLQAYEWRESPGRGIGVFATRDINAGDVVFSDLPSFIIADDALEYLGANDRPRMQWRGVLQLPKREQDRSRSLAVSQGTDLISDVLHTNSIGLVIGEESEHGALVPDLARANHACRPNSFYRFIEHNFAVELFTLRDIKAGEELTVSYANVEIPSKQRQEYLFNRWGFNCTCNTCAAGKEKTTESDQRLVRMYNIKNEIHKLGKDNPQRVLDLAVELLELYDEEGLITEKAIYSEMAAISAIALGDQQTAKAFAKDALNQWGILAGQDSDEYKSMLELLADPTKHSLWNTH